MFLSAGKETIMFNAAIKGIPHREAIVIQV